MTWKIEYYDGTNWQELTGTVESILQELNGHEEAIIKLFNNPTNRQIVSSNRDVRISFRGEQIFKGMLYAVEYSQNWLTCKLYNKCFEIMKSKLTTHDYSAGKQANLILQDICADAGVSADCSITTIVYVVFDHATCFDAAVWLAKSLNKDYWATNTTFHIGTRDETNRGEVTAISVSRRGIDRSKKRDKVIVRGKKADGTEITAEAGTGTNVAFFIETKPTDQATLNTIAQQKLNELNKDSSGVSLTVDIATCYKWQPGNLVTVNMPALALSGQYKIWKITKRRAICSVEIDRPEEILEKYIQATKNYEDLGIYVVSPAPCGSGTAFPTGVKRGFLFYRTDQNRLYRCNQDTCTLDEHWQLIVKVFGEGTEFPASPRIGDMFYRTDENILYWYNGTAWVRTVQIIDEGTAFPSNPKIGDMFYRTDENILYEWDGSSWIRVVQTSGEGSSFPTSPKVGDLFYRTDLNEIYRWNGSSWVRAIQITGEGTAFPASPKLGDMFYRTDENILYRWNGSSWIRVHETTGEGSAFPTSPKIGDLFFRTDSNALYRYDGTEWNVIQALSQHGTEFPPSPRVGDFFYMTDLNCLFRYDGTNWVAVLRVVKYGDSFPIEGRFVGDTFYHTRYEQTFYWDGSAWKPLATICRSGNAFPTDKVVGDIFFRTDELKFYRWDGTDWILLAEDIMSSPEENMIPNSSFEVDRDNNGVPDHWDKDFDGNNQAVVSLDSAVKDEGYKSCKITGAGIDQNAVACKPIPVQPGKNYFLRCRAKASVAIDYGFYFRVFWYANNINIGRGDALSYTDIVPNGPLTTTFQEFSGKVTAPANAYFCRVALYKWTTNVITSHSLYFDSLWMFKQISWEEMFDDHVVPERSLIPIIVSEFPTEGNFVGRNIINTSITDGAGRPVRFMYTEQGWLPHGYVQTTNQMATNIGTSSAQVKERDEPEYTRSYTIVKGGGSGSSGWQDIGKIFKYIAEADIKHELTRVEVEVRMSVSDPPPASYEIQVKCLYSLNSGATWTQFGTTYSDTTPNGFTLVAFTGNVLTDLNQPIWVKLQCNIWNGGSAVATVTVTCHIKNFELTEKGFRSQRVTI